MSGGIGGGTDEGFDLSVKGQLHGFSTTDAAISLSGNDDYVLVEDSSDSLGVAWKENAHSSVTASSTTTFTNKSIALSGNTLTGTSAELKTAISDETGSGALAFATSPTFVTPVLGTPASGTLTNATGLVATTGLTATGTKDSTTYLTGNDTWTTISGGGSLEALYDSGTLTTEASDTYTPSEGTLIFPTYTGLMIVAEITCSGNPRVDLVLDGVTTGTSHYSTGGTIGADGARTDYVDSGVAYCPLISDTTTGSSNKNLVAKMDLFFSTETSAMLGWVWAVNRGDLKSEERMVDYYSVLSTANTIASVGIAVSTGTFTGRWFVYGYKA